MGCAFVLHNHSLENVLQLVKAFAWTAVKALLVLFSNLHRLLGKPL